MIEDAINSIKVTMNERISNPFVSAYSVSFIIVNWKLFLVFLSELSYEDKIKNVSNIYSDYELSIMYLFVVPISFAAFWTFVWPIINWGISAYWYFVKSLVANAKVKAERKRILTEKDAAEIHLNLDSQETKYLSLIREKQDSYDSLLDENRKLNSEIERIHDEIIDRDSSIRELNSQVREMSSRESRFDQDLHILKGERDVARQNIEYVQDNALRVADILPALKSFCISLSEAINYRGDEDWVKKRFLELESSFSEEEMMRLLDFFLSIGLFVREGDGYLVFGSKLKHHKSRIIGAYNNSPGPAKPKA